MAVRLGNDDAHRAGCRGSCLQLVGDDVDRRAAAAVPCRRRPRAGRLLEREHLLSGAAHDRVLRASDATDVADPADLRGHAQHHPLLQPALPVSDRAVGVGHVPFRTRTHRTTRRRRRRGPGVCVRAVPRGPVHAPASHHDAVDAACALRIPAIFCDVASTRAGGRRRGARAPGVVVRLLPVLLHAVCGGLLHHRGRTPRGVAAPPHMDAGRRGGRAGGSGSSSAMPSRTPGG